MNALTSKQRAYLMKLASGLEPIFQIGKNSLTPEFTKAVQEALDTARAAFVKKPKTVKFKFESGK